MKTFAPLVALVFLILCTACAEPTVPATSVPSPTPSPTPVPKVLTVCLSEEPDSLFIYGTESLAARHVWQAIYDGPLDSRQYAHQPVILAALPSMADGSAGLEVVTARVGDRVLAADGSVVVLSPGVMIEDAEGRHVAFEGEPVSMQQMVVTFTLRANLYWSDGMVLTADDSVYSFEIASDPVTPADTTTAELTAEYRAVDVRTIVWRGVPGFLDHFYYLNFWHPLPRHAWGSVSAADLLGAEGSTRRPLGWGPFVLDEWVPGDHIAVVRNPIYFRAPEGLPRVDEVVFRFISDPAGLAEELLAGRCDIVPHDASDAIRTSLSGQPGVQEMPAHDARWDLLAFGISPSLDHNRPDFFEDVRVRQGIAQCIDRQAIVDSALAPPGRVLHSYLPPEHPVYAGDVTVWGYDPEAGQKLLASAGWYDEDGDGVREAHSIPSIASGTSFQITYLTTDDPLRVQTAQVVQTYLKACGVQVVVEAVAPQTLFAPGPGGALFGRQFDLAQFSWRLTADPLCDSFVSSQVPGAGRWDSPNVAGFLDDEYDMACLSALRALPGSDRYFAGHMEAQRIFSERLPVLPLFQRSKIALASASVVGLAPDPTQPTELWNIEQLDLRP